MRRSRAGACFCTMAAKPPSTRLPLAFKAVEAMSSPVAVSISRRLIFALFSSDAFCGVETFAPDSSAFLHDFNALLLVVLPHF